MAPRLFISHASADKPLVDAFVKTVIRLGCGVPPGSIFYSSGAATGVPAGVNLNAFIRSEVTEATLVIAIITPTFQKRPFCVAELGAAWSRIGTDQNLLPLMIPDVTDRDLDGVLAGLHLRSIDDDAALDELHVRVCEATGTTSNPMAWGEAKRDWMKMVNDLVHAISPPGRPVLSAAACSRETNHMELFWTDGSGRVFYRWWDKVKGWSDEDSWDDPAAVHVAAVSRAHGDEWLFGVQASGEVWARRWRQNEQGWVVAGPHEVLPGRVVGPLTAVRRGEWDIELTAWTTDGRQCHLLRSDGAWSGWKTYSPRTL